MKDCRRSPHHASMQSPGNRQRRTRRALLDSLHACQQQERRRGQDAPGGDSISDASACCQRL